MRKLKTLLLASFLFPLQALASDDIGLLELVNYIEYSSKLASSGQPTKTQLNKLVEAKIDFVVNLAPVTSPNAYAEEGELIRELGIGYIHIPVNWEKPPLTDLEVFFEAMTAAKDKGQRVLVHCYVNARASTFSYLWRVLKLGEDKEAARKDLLSIWNADNQFEFDEYPAWEKFISDAEAKEW